MLVSQVGGAIIWWLTCV